MKERVKNFILSKRKYFAIVAFALVLIALASTYAWWRWSSEINALVNGKVCAPEIVFVGGTTINGIDLLPVRTKEEGIHKDISVNLRDLCDNDTAVLNINLRPDIFPEGLADSSFKWALYEVTTEEVNNEIVETETYVNSGNFQGKRQYVNENDLISIATDLIVTQNISTYRLYIWIDATMDNPSTIGDNSFRFKIYGTGLGAVYNEYTIKRVSSSSATTSFWGSEINANQVKSIRFITTDQVSDQWTNTYDLSSIGNSQDVTMYYVENGQTEDATPITLYDIYVASNNGASKIKTNTSTESMFAYLTNCEYIDAEGLDTSNATSMASMFLNSSKLSTLKISNWDTSKVSNMTSMFQNTGTSALSIDLSGFDTSKVTGITSMFYNCKASSIDVSNFSNDKVTNMYLMFRGCSNLVNLNLSNFKTPKVTQMRSMFKGCDKLKSIDVSSFDTSNVTLMNGMFEDCYSLIELDLSNFDTSNVIAFYALGGSGNGMFEDCSSLVSLDLSNFDTSKAQDMRNMFYGCSKLEFLNVSNFDISNVQYIDQMFGDCSSIEKLDLSSFKTFKATSLGNMFNGCKKLKELDISNLVTTQVTSMASMFYDCDSLKTIDLSNFNTPNLTNIAGMFQSSGVEEIDLSSLNPSNLTSINRLFLNCTLLKKVNFSGFDFSKINLNTNDFGAVPSTLEVIVTDCDQVGYFKAKWIEFTNVHTLGGDYCTA